MLDADDRGALGELARAALGAALSGKRFEGEDPGRERLERHCGCFVTLKTGGHLRGCLGCFQSDAPLWRTVPEYAAYSALEDPRFARNRLRAEDLGSVEMDVSVLSPLEPCADPRAIVPGVHGIYVRKDGRSGCFLPQVAPEQGWGVEDFWGHCCRDKAGLDRDAWKNPGIELMTFTAEVFTC
ncbi:MAG: AmmeMemoRadiSam system protein A [Planctomycetota bacterium]|jgi:AmmeMemoRadiSam system protein A|nr:AmmeMemoRadiSam system protein A [Planctomycetota bacterium]